MPSQSHRRWVLVAVFMATAGCTSEARRFIKFPDFFHPGSANYQRAEAIEHDPYPDNDVAPEVVGGRPLGYQEGVPEVERTRMAAPPPPGVYPMSFQGLPTANPTFAAPYPTTPGYPAVPPPVVTTPYPPPSVQPAPFMQQQRSPY